MPATPAQIVNRAPVRVLREPEAHVRYLGPECARISEGMRTGSTQGASYDVLARLQAEYRRKCAEDDRLARERVREDERRRSNDEKAVRAAEESSKVQSARHTAQCEQMQQALTSKRRRIDGLTPGERDDPARFERIHEERCKPGR
jgi:hypothetical protein